MGEKICYCFNYTDVDIADDARANGTSLIIQKIMASKEAGGCRCAIENPTGR